MQKRGNMKKFAALLLVGTMTFTLAACGSSSSSTATDNAAEKTTEAQENAAADTTAASGDLSESPALADGVLTVGTNAYFPPFEYIGESGEPEGFDMALIKEIGSRIGVEVEISDMEFGALVASIGNKIDVSIAGMTITDERKETVAFSTPYYDATQMVLVAAGSEIATADDLKGKNIGCQLGTTGNTIADEIEGANVSAYDKGVDAVNDLINGRVDVVIIDKNPAEVFAAQFDGQIAAIEGTAFNFDIEQYGIAMAKDDAVLQNAINTALEEVIADGTFDKLVEEYIMSSEASDAASTASTSAE